MALFKYFIDSQFAELVQDILQLERAVQNA